MIRFFRYARHADVPALEAAGWAVSGPLPGNHGFYCCLMIWTGKGEPT